MILNCLLNEKMWDWMLLRVGGETKKDERVFILFREFATMEIVKRTIRKSVL